MEIQDSAKRQRNNRFLPSSNYKKRRIVVKAGFFYLKSLGAPPISSSTDSPYLSICLRSDRLYTIGRNRRYCNIVFEDRRISKRHCQIFFDSVERKIFILDGVFLPFSSDLNEIRRRFRYKLESRETPDGFGVKASLNGVFVNGYRLGEGSVMDLSAGDEVSLVCGNELDRNFKINVGFVMEKVVFTEEILGYNEIVLNGFLRGEGTTNTINSERQKEVVGKGRVVALSANGFYKDFRLCNSEYKHLIARANFLLNRSRQILHSVDPTSYIGGCMNLNREKEISSIQNGSPIIRAENKILDSVPSNIVEISLSTKPLIDSKKNFCGQEPLPHCGLYVKGSLTDENSARIIRGNLPMLSTETVLVSGDPASVSVPNDPFRQDDNGISLKNAIGNCTFKGLPLKSVERVDQGDNGLGSKKDLGIVCPSSGKKFYLNRLSFMEHSSLDQNMVVSLPELLYPVESLSRMFIATFTSDILWFLSYCQVPNHLPVTVACHNTERCWSSSPDKRTSTPYLDFPNLVVVYPPFPEVLAFGRDRKKQGIACHHPKLLVLQREDSIRVVVTSANLVSKQWNSVTNTIWWQDFPCRSVPDYLSLFTHLTDGETIEDIQSDFAAQLAGFMASLLADVPSQAYWITELTKYDFGGAVGHLVASIPGFHMHHTPCPAGNRCAPPSIGMKFLGSVEASVVGLNYRFHTVADSNGAQLKTLAAFLGKCRENAFGMSKVALRRNTNILADKNAVSVLVCDLDEFSEGDYIQLGFLPRNIAKWVAPLCDAGFFSFSAYIYPKDVLAAALGGRNSKVQLILYVSQGPKFSKMSSLKQPEHVSAICSLVASVQRCVGLWRLQEVLGQYKWPESLETDFVYGSSSIGTSVNSQFLAAFSAAAGKKSVQFSDSEESDPEWGCWNASLELRKPSMRIIFPTIERVKDAFSGIWASRRMLCFSERTWQRLRSVEIFHDAIPHPNCRVGYPMHIKVARRRFQSKTCSYSFGWVYCGSHNFSPAAWGRPMSASGIKVDVATETSSLGSRLHVCNYELGIIFIVPPLDTSKGINKKSSNLEDIVLPFVLPAPKYQPNDRPATAQAMKEALADLANENFEQAEDAEENMDEEIPDEEEVVEVAEYVSQEKEEEKDYAETLWSQVDSSQS